MCRDPLAGPIVIVYVSGWVLLVIVKTNLQITAQVNYIGTNAGVLLNSPTDISIQSIKSGRNILLICMVALLLAIPVSTVILVSLVLSIEMSGLFLFASAWSNVCNSSINGILYISLVWGAVVAR